MHIHVHASISVCILFSERLKTGYVLNNEGKKNEDVTKNSEKNQVIGNGMMGNCD